MKFAVILIITQPSDKVENVTNICKLKQECWKEEKKKKWLFLEK